jgi:quinoprotein glucose dehydrogenase
MILSARNEGLFTPPSMRATVEMPGNNGGANWSGAAADSDSGMLYVVSKDLPAVLKLERDPKAPEGTVRYTSGFNMLTGANGLSMIGPPWTARTAYDLNDGTIRWTMCRSWRRTAFTAPARTTPKWDRWSR